MNVKEKRNPDVSSSLDKPGKWREEIAALRTVLLDSPLTEELKWGKPCYTLRESNVVIILPLKESCALLFAKGALLNDPNGILIQPTENTQAARQLRLTSVREIVEMEAVLRDYILRAIEVEKAGLEVTYKKTADYIVPAELQKKFADTPVLKTAFDALTPGRQRGYLLHFSAPKQSRTRESRIEKWTPQILAGKGLQDA